MNLFKPKVSETSPSDRLAESGHAAIQDLKSKTEVTLALVGNPNVGKSSLFNQITGMGVVTANYPGKTVELNMATTEFEGVQIGLMDLPGTYALGAISDDQWVARQGILDGKPDAVIAILDATNLERNLYLLFQILELSVPVVVGLNLTDYAERIGLQIDTDKLQSVLGLPVIPTIATKGVGVDQLMKRALLAAQGKLPAPHPPIFTDTIETEIKRITDTIQGTMKETPHSVPARALAILLLEGDLEFGDDIRQFEGGKKVLEETHKARIQLEKDEMEPSSSLIARERHRQAGKITGECVTRNRRKAPEQLLWRMSLNPYSGSFMLIASLVAIFAFLYYVGGFLSNLLTSLWQTYANPVIMSFIHHYVGNGLLSVVLKWGFSDGILAALAVGIPYIFTFYLLLAILEDSGYLNSIAFLTDSLMHHLGLHGRAMIPLIAAAGCNTPAIIGTRVLTSQRERTIASTLICLTPCSARTAVIMAMVAAVLGGWWTCALILLILAILFGVGAGMNAVLPGKPSGLVMELFPFRRPDPLTILRKTWYRFKDFTFVAAPIIIFGSMTLGLLYETGWINYITRPLSPLICGWLRLPLEAGIALIVAVLRKELALQLLLVMAVAKHPSLGGAIGTTAILKGYMTPNQIFVFALVNTIYIPCLATITMLLRELGWKRAVAITLFTITLAILLGGIISRMIVLI